MGKMLRALDRLVIPILSKLQRHSQKLTMLMPQSWRGRIGKIQGNLTVSGKPESNSRRTNECQIPTSKATMSVTGKRLRYEVKSKNCPPTRRKVPFTNFPRVLPPSWGLTLIASSIKKHPWVYRHYSLMVAC